MEYLTVRKSSPTEPPIQKSSQMAKRLNSSSQISSTSSDKNHLNEAGIKRDFQPFISGPVIAPKPDKSKSDIDYTRTPVLWVSPVLYDTRKWEGKCWRWGSPTHKTFWCTKYTRANLPQNLLSPGDRNKSNANAPVTVLNRKTSLPYLLSRLAGEDRGIGASITVFGYEGFDGNYMCGLWQLMVGSDKTRAIAWEASNKITATIHADSDRWQWALTRPGRQHVEPLTR